MGTAMVKRAVGSMAIGNIELVWKIITNNINLK